MMEKKSVHRYSRLTLINDRSIKTRKVVGFRIENIIIIDIESNEPVGRKKKT